MSFAATWMDLEIIILSEVGQVKTNVTHYRLYVVKQLNYNDALEYHKNPIKHLTISKLNFFSEFNSHFLNNQCPLPTVYHVTGYSLRK